MSSFSFGYCASCPIYRIGLRGRKLHADDFLVETIHGTQEDPAVR
jgi:hypothetical protein